MPPDNAKVETSKPFGKGTISGLAWSPDGTMIAVSGSAGIRLYSAATLEEIRFIPTDFLITSVTFSPDGRMLATGSADLLFSSRDNWRRSSPYVSKNNFVQLWKVENGDLLTTLKAGFSYVTTVAFSPDGTLLASGSMYPDDNAVRIWKLDSISNGDIVPWQLHKEHTRGIFGIHFSPDGSMLLSGSGDNSARLWDVNGDMMASILMYRPEAKVKVFAVDYSPDGQTVALAGADFFHNTPTPLLELWDTSTGKMVLEIDGHDSGLDSVAFSPDGQILVSGGSYPDNKIHIWDAHSGELIQTLQGHVSGVRNLVFSPDGKTLASSGWDAMLNLWDVETRGLLLTNDEHTSVIESAAISPNGEIIATGGDDGLIRLWDVETGQKINTMNTLSSRVNSLVFNPIGTTLIAGTDEPHFSVQIWNVESGQRLGDFYGHKNYVQVVALSQDGRRLASAGALGDNTVRIWDLAEDVPAVRIIEGVSRSAKSLAFSADGQTLATGDGTGTIHLINVLTGETEKKFAAQDCAITALVFDPRDDNLVSGGCNGLVRIWDVKTGKLLSELVGPDEFVIALGYYPGSQELVLGFSDGSIWFWDKTLDTPSVKIKVPTNTIKAFLFQREKLLVAMDSGDGMLRFWNILH